jgi:putative phage-type endonuclease
MQIIELVQGSPAWHEHRKNHRNASDTPSVTGHSPYKSRSKFMSEWVSGIADEVNASTQRIFDEGHRAEALARPLMESIIGEELFPCVGVDGVWSASFDGLTMSEEIAAEHKSLNDTLRAVTCSSELPIYYREQMEHQLMVCGGVKCLFMASKWNDDDTLAEEIHFWYEPDMQLRAQIIAAWDQFIMDAAEHKPQEYIPAPKAEVTIELPALFVHAKGEITEHNMEAFGTALTAKLSEVRAIALVTDQDFSNAKAAAKKFRETAKEITLSEAAMLAQTETIGEASRKMKAWVKDLNATALQLEKDVEREDLAKKRTMVSETTLAYSAHIEGLEAETRPIQLNIPRPDFALAIKGKSRYDKMQGALDDALAAGKIQADAVALDIRHKLEWFRAASSEHQMLFPDLAHIITKPLDDFKLLVTSRIDAHKQAEASKLVRIQEEANARAKAAQEAQLAAERAKMEAEVRAKAEVEAERMANDARLVAIEEQRRAAEERKTVIAMTPVDNLEERRKQAQIAESAAMKSAPTILKPSDGRIIEAVMHRFNCSHALASDWILECAKNMRNEK